MWSWCMKVARKTNCWSLTNSVLLQHRNSHYSISFALSPEIGWKRNNFEWRKQIVYKITISFITVSVKAKKSINVKPLWIHHTQPERYWPKRKTASIVIKRPLSLHVPATVESSEQLEKSRCANPWTRFATPFVCRRALQLEVLRFSSSNRKWVKLWEYLMFWHEPMSLFLHSEARPSLTVLRRLSTWSWGAQWSVQAFT